MHLGLVEETEMLRQRSQGTNVKLHFYIKKKKVLQAQVRGVMAYHQVPERKLGRGFSCQSYNWKKPIQMLDHRSNLTS